MAVQDYKINYKSDFVLTINGDAGWAVPFCIKFWTGMPSQAYFVGFDGVKYVNCRVGDTPTQLLVIFDDHHMPIGPLKMQIAYHTTIEEFPGSVFDEVTNARDVIVTIDGTDYQVMLDFTGEDAPELEFNLPAYANEAERIQNELQRQQNEADRIAAELQREQATAAAVQGAENVNAQLNGTTLTVTNRQGVSTSVNTKGEQGEQGPVGPEGPQGEQGETGISIVSFTPKSETSTTLIYTVTFSDGHTQDVAIPKGAKGDTGATGPQGQKGDTGVSITAFTYASETETDIIYNITFSDGTTQAVAIPKGGKGDQGPTGPQGPQGPMGDVAVITPEQQAAFTMYSVPGQNTNGPMTQKAVTAALVAGSISYDNSASGLAANNVQGALDELNRNNKVLYHWDDISQYGSVSEYGFVSDGYYINVTGTNRTKYTHRPVRVPTGATLFNIEAKSERSSYICLASAYSIPTANNQSVTFCTNFPERIKIPAGTVKSLEIPSDCTYIIVNVLGNNVDYSPLSMYFGYAEKEKEIDISHVVFKEFWNSSSTYRWLANKSGALINNVFVVDSGDRIHKVLERDEKAAYIKVTANNSNGAYFGFLKSYTQPASNANTLADFCDGEVGCRRVKTGETGVLVIPDDCKYIVFDQMLSNNTNVLPLKMSWGYDDVDVKAYDEWVSKGKKVWDKTCLGIIGDSLSTYKGLIMSGASTVYGVDYMDNNVNFGPAYGVTSVGQTWWKMFANSVGFDRIQNLSWGGSGVIHRETRLSLYERTLLLDDDCSMVVIALGANDAGESQPLSPSEDWNDYWDLDIDELDESEFVQGLIKGVKQIQHSCPSAKIMLFCTARETSEAGHPYAEAEEAVAEHYGLLFLNMIGLYSALSPYNLPSDVHPNVNQMGFIYSGLMDYLKGIDFEYPEVDYKEYNEIEFTTIQGSIDVSTGEAVSTSDTNRIATDYFDTSSFNSILLRKAHLTSNFRFACYDSDKNYIGISDHKNWKEHKLCAGTRYARISLTTTGQVISSDFEMLAIPQEKSLLADDNYIDIRLSNFMNPLQTDQQNIVDCLAFASGFNKKVIHFDVERLTVNSAILLESNTTILLEDCTIKQADETFDNVFRSANLNPNGNGGQDMPSDIPMLENIKIIGVGKANIIGPDVNASSGGTPLVGDDYGFRTWQICMVRAKGIEISNISFTKTRCWCITFELCENVSVHELSIRSNVENGDGIDFRVGCKHCEVYNMFASTTDDAVACTALGNLEESTGSYCSKPTWKLWTNLLNDDPLSLDIEDVSVRDVRFSQTVNSSLNGGHGLICLSAYGSKVHNVSIDRFNEVAVGDSNNDGLIKIYHGYGSGYTDGDINTIRLNDIVCTHFHYTLQVTGGIVEDVRANKLVNNASGGSTVSVSSGNVIGENVIVTNS